MYKQNLLANDSFKLYKMHPVWEGFCRSRLALHHVTR